VQRVERRMRERTLMLAAALLASGPAAACAGEGASDSASGSVADASATVVAAARAAPTEGLDSALIAAAFDRAAALPRLRTLIVARHGEILSERRFRGPALDAPANVKSVSKSVLSALVGIAIAEQHLDGVDQPVAPFFHRYLSATDDPRKHDITVGHLLSMQSGLEQTSGARYGAWVSSPNWVRYAISRRMIADPGSTRLYSTGNSHLLSAILASATGQNTWLYARQRLAEPLGVPLPRWPADPQGVYFGGNEMRLSPRALVRFGELYRNGGRHDGRQIVPEAWVRASLTAQTAARRSGEGYGFGWFISHVRGYEMFYAWGYGGQFIFVVPDLELTVVTTSDPDVDRERDHIRMIRQLLSDWIVPAAQAGGPRDAGAIPVA
jgi:CubicO group peptidase (beta-lactamase class C family)